MSQPANDNRVPDAAAQSERPRLCPICRKPAVQEFRPFCSKRCADLDLARWLGGRYAIPAESNEAEDAAGSPEDEG